MRKQTWDNRGSFTIEAAVIITFLVITINALLFLSFFLYNRCSVERAAAMGALRGSQAVWVDNSCRYQAADKGVNTILTNNLLGSDTIEKQIKVNGEKVTVFLNMDFFQWNFQTKAEKKCLNPVLYIRNCRKIEGLGKERE